MRVADNSGRGNCLYFAYAVSFILYLKSLPRDNLMQREVFSLLRLSFAEKHDLEDILASKRDISFTDRRKIETILGPKLRLAAATTLTAEFNLAPENSSLFTAISYEFRRRVKFRVGKVNPQLAKWIAIATDPTVVRSYKDADIYRVPGIYTALDEFAVTVLPEFLLLKDVNEVKVDEFFKNKVIHFFKKNNGEQLKKYFDLLNRNGFWGTEEALGALHRFLTGEESISMDSRFEIQQQRPMSLQIYKNGRLVSSRRSIRPANIVLENQNNSHWVSLVPSLTDFEIRRIAEPESYLLERIAFENSQIDKLLAAYTSRPIQDLLYKSREKALRAGIVKTVLDYKEKLLCEVVEGYYHPENPEAYTYEQLLRLKSVLKTLLDDRITQTAKIRCLEKFEIETKRDSHGWNKLQKYTSAFLIAAVASVLGILIGAAMGGIMNAPLGPGGTLVGAIWGAFKAGNLGVVGGTVFGFSVGLNSGNRVLREKSQSDYLAREYTERSKYVLKRTNTIPMNEKLPQLRELARRPSQEKREESKEMAASQCLVY